VEQRLQLTGFAYFLHKEAMLDYRIKFPAVAGKPAYLRQRVGYIVYVHIFFINIPIRIEKFAAIECLRPIVGFISLMVCYVTPPCWW